MTAVSAAESRVSMATVRRLFRDQPVIPLIGLLILLLILMQIAQPGVVTPSWLG